MKTDWQRLVLASSGYLELGMFDDAALAPGIVFAKVLHGMKRDLIRGANRHNGEIRRYRSTERRTDSSPSSRVSTPKLPQRTNSRSGSGCETSSWAGRKVG